MELANQMPKTNTATTTASRHIYRQQQQIDEFLLLLISWLDCSISLIVYQNNVDAELFWLLSSSSTPASASMSVQWYSLNRVERERERRTQKTHVYFADMCLCVCITKQKKRIDNKKKYSIFPIHSANMRDHSGFWQWKRFGTENKTHIIMYLI